MRQKTKRKKIPHPGLPRRKKPHPNLPQRGRSKKNPEGI
jgi:hypothetical protein